MQHFKNYGEAECAALFKEFEKYCDLVDRTDDKTPIA